jgi:hypothetical protein
MGFIKKWFARMSREAWEEARKENSMTISVSEKPRGDSPPKHFAIHTALNGTYISFQMHKYNPTGPDEYTSEVYLVRDGEAVIDAIATVMVLMDARGRA